MHLAQGAMKTLSEHNTDILYISRSSLLSQNDVTMSQAFFCHWVFWCFLLFAFGLISSIILGVNVTEKQMSGDKYNEPDTHIEETRVVELWTGPLWKGTGVFGAFLLKAVACCRQIFLEWTKLNLRRKPLYLHFHLVHFIIKIRIIVALKLLQPSYDRSQNGQCSLHYVFIQ